MSAEDSAQKQQRVQKTLTLDIDLILATETAVGTGLAKDFSAAAEDGLKMLLRANNLPEKLTPDELRKRLSGQKMRPLLPEDPDKFGRA